MLEIFITAVLLLYFLAVRIYAWSRTLRKLREYKTKKSPERKPIQREIIDYTDEDLEEEDSCSFADSDEF